MEERSIGFAQDFNPVCVVAYRPMVQCYGALLKLRPSTLMMVLLVLLHAVVLLHRAGVFSSGLRSLRNGSLLFSDQPDLSRVVVRPPAPPPSSSLSPTSPLPPPPHTHTHPPTPPRTTSAGDGGGLSLSMLATCLVHHRTCHGCRRAWQLFAHRLLQRCACGRQYLL